MEKQILIHDISFWQDNDETPHKADFNKMKASGAQGVILRVGQGNYYDEDVSDYYAASKGILPRGLYWFYDSRAEPLTQARKFAGFALAAGMPEMELWADYEENYNGAYKGWKHFAVFLAELEKVLPTAKIGIYTGYYYWQSHCPNWFFQSASFNWFKRFPLWLAWYTTDDKIVKIPSPWKSCLLWQYSSHGDGIAAGVESKNIDCNYFQGSQTEFELRYDTTYVPPVVVPPTPTPVTKPGIYRIKDDLEAGWEPNGPRPYLRNGLPSAVPLFGGAGTLKVPARWVAYLRTIMTDKVVDNYLFREASGWQNGTTFGVVRELTFSGNIVNVLSVVGNKAYVETVLTTSVPPSIPVKPPVDKPHKLIHRFSIQYDNHLDMTTDGRNAYIILFSNPGEKLWIDTRNLVKV